jgi:DNA-binding MarR family transcriptional regulator
MIPAMTSTKPTSADAAIASAGPTSADAAIASVEAQFGEMFNRVRISMRDRAARVHPDLQPGGYVILSTLARLGPTHAGTLAEVLATDKSIVSRQAKLLEEAGLLERTPDPDDKRATFFAVTPDARQRIDEVRLSDQAALHAQLGTWSLADLNRLSGLLARVNETF